MRAELCATQLRLYDQSKYVHTHTHRRMHIKHFWLCRLVPVAFAVYVCAASLFSVWYQNAFMFSFVIKSVILAARTWQRAGQGRTGGMATDISMEMYALEWALSECRVCKRNSQGNFASIPKLTHSLTQIHIRTHIHTHTHRCWLSVWNYTRLRFGSLCCAWLKKLLHTFVRHVKMAAAALRHMQMRMWI